jgi:hypothetical protein
MVLSLFEGLLQISLLHMHMLVNSTVNHTVIKLWKKTQECLCNVSGILT